MNLEEKIKQKREDCQSSCEKYSQLIKKLKELKTEKKVILDELNSLEKQHLCNKYKLELNKTIIYSGDNQYLLRDISLGTNNPIVSEKNKDGKWGKKSFDLGLFDWEKWKRKNIKVLNYEK